MSRFGSFVRGVSASWLATLATVVYSLLSVPIALRFLSVDEFGLLMLLLQVAAYLNLVDLGMAAATARILIDHKDNPRGGDYGSFILAGGAVCLLQGIIILVAGWFGSPFVIRAFAIAPDHAEIAVFLLRWLAAAFAVGAFLRIFGSILYANKRVDIVVLFMSLVPLLGLVLMWTVLSSGMGMRGLAWTFVIPAVIAGSGTAAAVITLGLLPGRTDWRRPSWEQFREMFILGKDMFLINAGSQILDASQLMIVTRTMGLGAAAVWSVSTKLFTLVYQLVTKVEGTAIVFFSEMMVRGERPLLALRFRQVYQLTAGLSVAAVATVAGVNPFFVSVWAEPDLAWAAPLGLLLGIVTYLNCVTRCHVDLIMHSKKIRGLRYVFFFEAIGFVLLAVFASSHIGFTGVLASAILCAVCFRGIYTFHRTAAYFHMPVSTVSWVWLRRSILTFAGILPFVLSAPHVAELAVHPWGKLAVAALWTGIPAALALVTVALPGDVRREMLDRLPGHLR